MNARSLFRNLPALFLVLLLATVSSSCPCQEECVTCYAFGKPDGSSDEQQFCDCQIDDIGPIEESWIDDKTGEGFVSAYCLQ